MNAPLIKTIALRLLFLGAGVIVLAFAYLIVRISLAPVEVPSAPSIQRNVAFDPRLDVGKNAAFTHMRPLSVTDFTHLNLGRENPFLPAPTSTPAQAMVVVSASTVQAATSTPVPTSTASATSTP